MTNALNIRYYLQLNNEDRFVSFLPMNHIAAQYVDTMIPVRNRITMYLARPDALRGSLVATLRKARPRFSWRSHGSTRSSWRASVRRTRRRR